MPPGCFPTGAMGERYPAMRKSLMVMVAWMMIAALATAQEPKPEGDLAALQGEWTSEDDQGTAHWTFDGNRLTIKAPTRSYEMTITLDPKMKPHKHIDFEVLADSPNAAGTKAPGIYEIVDENNVRIAVAAANTDRPDNFKSSPTRAFAFDLKKKK